MTKKIVFLFSVAVTFLWSCEEQAGDPRILFENGLDSINEIFPGDLFQVKGRIVTEEPLAGAFYFHQKIDETGKLDESGDRLELGVEGSADSFTLGFLAEPTTVGVKIIAEDVKGNRSVKIFKVIQGIDDLEITLDDPGYIDDIESGEPFHVKGRVTSKTKISSLNYRIIKGDIEDAPVSLDLTGDLESRFDIPLTARNGMTGVMVTAVNKGSLTTNKLFEIKHVTAIGPVVIFDDDMIKVKPDSTFTVTGRISSNLTVTGVSFVVVREGSSDPAQTVTLADNRFSFVVNAGEDVKSVGVTAVDSNGNEGLQSVPVTILFPRATVGDVMIHYEYIILTDEKYPKCYFSFSMAPYVLNGTQAKANQSSVNLLYSNCFISDGHASNGPAIFGPNVSTGTTIKANDLVEGWATPYNLTRLPSATDFYSMVGKTFDEIGDNQEDWNLVDTYVKNKIASSSVVRQFNMSEGHMFAIGFGGTSVGEINKYAIAIVRGFGGEKATSSGESTGAWLEIEIKMRK